MKTFYYTYHLRQQSYLWQGEVLDPMTVINNLLLLKCEGNNTISTVKLQKASRLLKKRGPEHCPQKKGIARGSRKTKNKEKNYRSAIRLACQDVKVVPQRGRRFHAPTKANTLREKQKLLTTRPSNLKPTLQKTKATSKLWRSSQSHETRNVLKSP